MSQCVLPWVYPICDCTSWAWVTVLSHVREVFNYNLFKYFLQLFLFFFQDPFNSNVSAFNVVPKVSETVLISFHSFFFTLWQIFPPFCLPGHLSVFIPQLLYFFPPSVFISVLVLFISVYLFFSSSRSLVNIFYIFLISAPILLPRSWNIFTIIITQNFILDSLSPLHLVVFV